MRSPYDILQTLGLKNLRLDINSVGNKQDRLNLSASIDRLFDSLQRRIRPRSQDRLTRNPLRILDSKDQRTQEIVAGGPSILQYFGEQTRSHFEKVQQLCTDLGICYQ